MLHSEAVVEGTEGKGGRGVQQLGLFDGHSVDKQVSPSVWALRNVGPPWRTTDETDEGRERSLYEANPKGCIPCESAHMAFPADRATAEPQEDRRALAREKGG